MSQSCDYLPRFNKSLWSLSMPFWVCTTLNTFVSSANFNRLLQTASSMSLICIRNRKGPRTEPWGTPLFTRVHLELLRSITTLCSLSLSQSSIHLNLSDVFRELQINYIYCRRTVLLHTLMRANFKPSKLLNLLMDDCMRNQKTCDVCVNVRGKNFLWFILWPPAKTKQESNTKCRRFRLVAAHRKTVKDWKYNEHTIIIIEILIKSF